MKKHLFIFLFLAATKIGHAQDITEKTISWVTEKTLNTTEGRMELGPNRIMVKGREKIDWQDVSGTIRATMPITEIQGSWADAGTIGEIRYKVSNIGQPGLVTIKRTEKGASINISLMVNGRAQLYQLTVVNFKIMEL